MNTFFSKIAKINTNNDFTESTQFNAPLFGATREDNGMFRVNLKEEVVQGTTTTETVAYINSATDDLKDNTEIEELVIPTKVSITSSESTKEYKVAGIESGALQGEAFSSTKLSKITINGWEEHEGKIEGGWFKMIDTNSLQHYNQEDSVTHLTTITLPDCLSQTGVQVFNQNEYLTTINVQKYNQTTNTITEEEGLPSGLSELSENMFVECRSLNFSENFVIPSNIKFIGAMCFDKCSSLTTINIGNGVKTIDNNGFSNCTSLTKIYMGSSLTTINTHSFTGDTALKELILGESLTTLGEEAFSNCTSLETIDFKSASKLTDTGVGTFMNCSSLTHLEFTDSNVKKIGAKSFLNCYKLNNIKFNDTTEELDEYCFSNWTETAATTTASKLEYVYLPESTTRIQKAAFQNSQNLKEVIIGLKNGPDDTESDDIVGESAFANCPSLVSVTFLWDVPWQLYLTSFKYTGTTGIIGETPAIDVRFRPLSPHMAWLKPHWYSKKPLDQIFPVGSRLCISAVFCDDYYGNDLENYLEQNGCTQEEVDGGADAGAYDNETFDTYNKAPMANNVTYKLGVSIPDTVTIKNDCTTDKIMKSKTKGANSKTIDFVYDNTEITQTTYTSGTAKTIKRDADDGILDMGNTAIQINVGSKTGTVTTLNVTRTNKNGTKTNPCIYGHTDKSSTSNPFASTYDYLTADTNLMNDVGYPEEKAVREPRLNEHEESDKPRGLFSANDDPTYDMEVNNACCIFCRSNAILNISNITFGGDLYNPITEKPTRTDNICELGCVYNSGTMTMTNCSFENSSSTWGASTNEATDITSYGGSCVFNFGTGTMTTCVMKNSSAALDGGAVMNVDTLTMTGCTIEGCSAKHFGGAVYDNLGDPSKGGTGKYGILTIDGCTFNGNSAAYGGAIKYRNRSESGPAVQLTLEGSCSFTGNKDLKENADDLCMGPNYEDKAQTTPFALDGFKLQDESSKVTVSAIRQKAGLILCEGGAASAGLFLSKNPALEISAGEGDTANDMIFKTTTTTYTLTADDNGHWVEIVDGVETEVTSFTAVGTTPPTAAEKITYKDADGVQHTLTAKPTSEEYEFSECTYSETTRTFTATFTAKQQQDVFGKIKTSIKNRNSDAKENAKLEIYAR